MFIGAGSLMLGVSCGNANHISKDRPGYADVGAHPRRCDRCRTLSPGTVRVFLSSTFGLEISARGYCIGRASGGPALWGIPWPVADIRIIVAGPLMMHLVSMAATSPAGAVDGGTAVLSDARSARPAAADPHRSRPSTP